MRKVHLAARARLDLRDTLLYLRQNNPPAARRFLDELTARFALLGQFPEMGIMRPELRPHLRSTVVDSYLIFYQPEKTRIKVIRIVHGARDLRRIFRRRRRP
jgi:toxin ParE1/3/4